jgi:hypothetical protein
MGRHLRFHNDVAQR